MFLPAELIKKKKLGLPHTKEEILWLINEFTANRIPDYQMSAWAMAVWFRGMNDEEIAALTLAMRDSGAKFDFSFLNAPRIDKHSTGGVGDKTSLIIGPVLAAAEVFVPMIAGRGLGHTGGTLDKLESIPGFRVGLGRDEFVELIRKKHFALMGQTLDICPADRKFYSLRDVTSTIDSLPLICGSIMSKKLAEDLTGLVLDVKFGTGAFMKSLEDARKLALLLKSTGEKNGVRVTALLSNMNEPLGRFSGNALEIKECVEIMSGQSFVENGFDFYEPTRTLTVELCAHMFLLAGRVTTAVEGRKLADDIIRSGKALAKFHELLKYQGPADLSKLPTARFHRDILSKKSGILTAINTESIGLAGIALGAGRRVSTDSIDYTAGIETQCRVGWKVDPGQPLFRIHGMNEALFDDAEELIHSSLEFNSALNRPLLPLVAEVIP